MNLTNLTRNSVRLVAAVALIALAIGANAADSTFTAGENYKLVKNPEPGPADGTVEVVEFFFYGCGHCYAFEPYIEKWLETKPDNVSFRRIPGVASAQWVPLARVYYALESLGATGKTHQALFDAIHKDRTPFNNLDDLATFFAGLGVDEAAFKEAYNSFDVNRKVKEAEKASVQYRITGVPTVVVGGKYTSSASLTDNSFDELLKLVDQLVAMETAD